MRTGVVAGASLTGALVLSAGLLAWGTADLVSGGDPDNAATALVPPDGARTLGTDDGGSLTVTEHARLTGPEAVLGSPPAIGGALVSTLDGDPLDWRIWRSTTTTYDADEDTSGEQVTTLRRISNRGVEQVAAYGPFPVVFDPPMLEVPADVHDGSQWSGEGSASPDGDLDYAVALAAEDADDDDDPNGDDDKGDGCLRITGTVSFLRDGEALLESPTDERWCPGRGVVDDDAPEEPPAWNGDTEPMPPRAVDVRDWGEDDRQLLLANSVDTAGDTSGAAAPRLDAPAAGAGRDRLVLADGQSRDVLGFVRAGESLVRAWVGHPGGSVTAVATSGDVTVVGTSRRQVVAYGPDGGWLWTYALDDVPVVAPLAVDDDHLVVTSAAGEVVALDPATGEALWDGTTDDRVGIAPVSDGEVVVVADESGTVSARDLDDGDELWSTEVTDALAVGLVEDRTGDSVVVHTGDAAQAFALDDGRRLWSSRLDSTGGDGAVADLGRTVAVASSLETVGLDPRTGEEVWRADGADVSLGVERTLVQIDEDDVLRAVDEDGETLGRWRLPQLRSTVRYLSLAPFGVWVTDGSGIVVEVGQ